MKKIAVLIALIALLIPSAWSETYSTVGFTVDMSINSNEELQELVVPFRVGLYGCGNFTADGLPFGFHIGGDVSAGINTYEDSFDALLGFSFLAAPVAVFGSKLRCAIAVGPSAGAELSDYSRTKDVMDAPKYTESRLFFQAYAGAGVNFTMFFSDKFSLGLLLGYYPFCYSGMSIQKSGYSHDIEVFDPVFRVSIIVGLCNIGPDSLHINF